MYPNSEIYRIIIYVIEMNEKLQSTYIIWFLWYYIWRIIMLIEKSIFCFTELNVIKEKANITFYFLCL